MKNGMGTEIEPIPDLGMHLLKRKWFGWRNGGFSSKPVKSLPTESASNIQAITSDCSRKRMSAFERCKDTVKHPLADRVAA